MAKAKETEAIKQAQLIPHIERFMAFVEKDSEDSCWFRNSRGKENGYTSLTVGKKRVSAHRFSFIAFNRDLKIGEEIDHLCRDRACVNPRHLEAVTRQENLKRRDLNYQSENWTGTTIERLMSRVEKSEDSCWIWNGALVRGYGILSVAGKLKYAHRVIYEELIEMLKPDETIDHLCRNPRCVNPQHLEKVTRSENTRRMNSSQPRNRCRNGHYYHITGKTTSGRCVACYEKRPSRLAKKTNPDSDAIREYKPRKRENSEHFCANGHDYAKVGRFKNGACRQCQTSKDFLRGKRKSNRIMQQFCPEGHDCWITGRLSDGHCRACHLNGYCRKGHNKVIHGVTKSGACGECARMRRIKHQLKLKSTQFCKFGHDTFELGRTPSGACKVCAKNYARQKNSYKHTAEELLVQCKNGHVRTPKNTKVRIRSVNGIQKQHRECRDCLADNRKRYEAKHRAGKPRGKK